MLFLFPVSPPETPYPIPPPPVSMRVFPHPSQDQGTLLPLMPDKNILFSSRLRERSCLEGKRQRGHRAGTLTPPPHLDFLFSLAYPHPHTPHTPYTIHTAWPHRFCVCCKAYTSLPYLTSKGITFSRLWF